MEAFLHRIKNKGDCDFLSHTSDFWNDVFILQIWLVFLKIVFISCNYESILHFFLELWVYISQFWVFLCTFFFSQLTFFLVILCLHLAILTFFSEFSEFNSSNFYFFRIILSLHFITLTSTHSSYFFQNSECKSHNCFFFLRILSLNFTIQIPPPPPQNSVYISQFWEKKIVRCGNSLNSEFKSHNSNLFSSELCWEKVRMER